MGEWAFWLATTAITLMMGIIGYYFKKTSNETSDAIRSLNLRVEKLEDKLASTVAQMPFNYTLREDFIRSMSGVEAKLNMIIDRLPPRGRES